VSHTSKIALKILTRRLESTAESYLGKHQFGFRNGRGTRDAIAALRVLYKRNLEYNSKVYAGLKVGPGRQGRRHGTL